MVRRIPLIVTMLLAACASSPNWRPSPEALARRRARVEKVHALESERLELRRRLARESLENVRATEEWTERLSAVERACRLAPEVLTDLPPDEAAALAPDVLKVYDLSAVLDAGLDAPADLSVPAESGGEQGPGRDGGGQLLRRIARLLRVEWPEPSFVAVAGEHLLVLTSPDLFDDVESALDRLAVVGGPVLQVRADLVVEAPDSEDGSVTWLEAGEALPETTGMPLEFDVPYGRERGAQRGASRSYLADFDVHAGVGAADPIVRRLVVGIAVNVAFCATGPAGFPVAEVRVSEADLVQPVPEFTTSLGVYEDPVRIQLPEVLMTGARGTTAVGGSRAALVRLSRGRALLVRLTERGDEEQRVRPGWRRVEPAGSVRVDRVDPLVQHAIEIARARLDLHQEPAATEVLQSALADGPRGSWTRRACIHPEQPEVALVRRPVDRAPEEVLAALGMFHAEPAGTCGFLVVRDGVLVGCVETDSVGAVDRAIGALSRTGVGGSAIRARAAEPRPQTPAPGVAGGAIACVDAESISYVEDFDVEVAEDAWIADPIIGVIQDGAVLEARPVAGQPGVYDVRIAHAWLERPIPVFETSIGPDSSVSIQMPRFRVHETSRRVRVTEGETREIESTVRRGAAGDTRRFVIHVGE